MGSQCLHLTKQHERLGNTLGTSASACWLGAELSVSRACVVLELWMGKVPFLFLCQLLMYFACNTLISACHKSLGWWECVEVGNLSPKGVALQFLTALLSSLTSSCIAAQGEKSISWASLGSRTGGSAESRACCIPVTMVEEPCYHAWAPASFMSMVMGGPDKCGWLCWHLRGDLRR